jgi:putative ABC transport system permease protein
MVRSFFSQIWRNLTRHKGYSFINIFGLALGMAAFILISAYVDFEKSFDRMHRDGDNIYRVESSFYRGAQMTDDWPTSTNGYGKAMKSNFPEIAAFTRINWNNSERVVRYKDIRFREAHVCLADTNFFSFFSYPLLKGNPATVLKDVNTVVLSESAAKRYFHDADPMGQFLEVGTIAGSLHCQVTGVFKDLPANSTMQFELLISWASSPEWMKDTWYLHESYTFVKLNASAGGAGSAGAGAGVGGDAAGLGAQVASVEAKFPALAEKYKTGPALKELRWAIHLVPLADIHLNPAKQYEIEVKGNRRAVQFLSLMAFVILTIACVNYVNLYTARAMERAKEVGIRKVSGARPGQLVGQFLLESTVVNSMALALAVGMVLAVRLSPVVILGSGLSFGLLFDASLYFRTAGVFFFSVLASGLYPALVLANIKPIVVLKGRYSFSRGGLVLRKGLVIFQFAISLLLIVGTLAVYRQIGYMSSQDLGVRIDRTLVVKAPVNTVNYEQKIAGLKNAFRAIPTVAGVAGSGAVPGKEVGEFLADRRLGAPKTEERLYEMLKVDHDFIGLYGLQLIAGRAFDRGRPADSTGLVLNEAAVQQFGFSSPEKAIGEKIWLEVNKGKPNEIIGVVKNYHQRSLQQGYTPVILFMDPDYKWIPSNYYSVKVSTGGLAAAGAGTGDMAGTLDRLKKTWAGFFPESSFDFFFLDDFYDRQYQQERQFGGIFGIFSSLAIFIACMGLFGLTAYSTARRTKEIGIRKTLGASVQNILLLLTRDLVVFVFWAGVVALPLAWLLIGRWMQGYAFRVRLSWWQFAGPVLALLIVAIITTSWLSMKAALANPVNTLKQE